jgi:hypothetical protein
MTQHIVWEGIAIVVNYEPVFLNTDFCHIELKAPVPLPVTETGYRSHFMPIKQIELFTDHIDFVTQWLDAWAESPAWKQHLLDSQQLSLF